MINDHQAAAIATLKQLQKAASDAGEKVTLDPEEVQFLLIALGDESDIEPERTIPLRTPITVGDIVYDKITLREPTARQIAESQRKESAFQMIELIALNSKLPRQVIENLRTRDLAECADFFDGFTRTRRSS